MAKSSKEFLDGLAALADGLRRQIDANLDGWDVSPEAIAERRRKVFDPVSGYEYWDRNSSVRLKIEQIQLVSGG